MLCIAHVNGKPCLIRVHFSGALCTCRGDNDWLAKKYDSALVTSMCARTSPSPHHELESSSPCSPCQIVWYAAWLVSSLLCLSVPAPSREQTSLKMFNMLCVPFNSVKGNSLCEGKSLLNRSVVKEFPLQMLVSTKRN